MNIIISSPNIEFVGQMYHNSIYTCAGCQCLFQSSHALSTQQATSFFFNDYITPLQNTKSIQTHNNEQTKKTQLGKRNTTKTTHNQNIHNKNVENPNSDIEDSITVDSDKLVTDSPFHFSNSILHELKLIQIILDVGVPLYAHEKLMKWAHEAHMAQYKFDTNQKGTIR